MTLAEDIGAALIGAGFASAVGTDLFFYRFPDSPHAAIMVAPYGGSPGLKMLGDTEDIEYPRIQVIVRNTSAAAAEIKAEAIRSFLNNKSDLTGYIFIKALQSHSFLVPFDPVEKGRSYFVCNYEVMR